MQLCNESPLRGCNLERVACRVPRQWLYLFGDEGGVVYSETYNRFAGLDAAGVTAFLAFDAGLPFADQLTPNAADALGAYRIAEGSIEPIRELALGTFPATEPQPEWPAFKPDASRDASGVLFEIAGIPVSIEYPPGRLAKLCHDPFQGCKPTPLAPCCHISAQPTEGGWAIYVNGRLWMPIEKEDQLGLGFMHVARSVLYRLGSYDVAFHAAMVGQGNCGLLLCAPRERGKSTLAAYLAAKGFNFLADEPALLQLDSRSVQPIPLPISLKEGSWSYLQKEWQQLGAAPIHVRSDDVPICFLHLPQQRRSLRPRQITHFVFPCYSPSSTEQPERLSPLKALCLLNAGGMLFSHNGTREKFEIFLNLLCQIPAFTLPFSSLPEAIQALRVVCEC